MRLATQVLVPLPLLESLGLSQGRRYGLTYCPTLPGCRLGGCLVGWGLVIAWGSVVVLVVVVVALALALAVRQVVPEAPAVQAVVRLLLLRLLLLPRRPLVGAAPS